MKKIKSQKVLAAAKGVLAVVFISAVALLLIQYLGKVFSVSEYFAVQEVLTNEGKTDSFEFLKEHNIFAVDLRKESEYLSSHYPDYRTVRLYRVFPSRIFVDFVKRKPVARLKLYRIFFVDEEGVLFTPAQELAQEEMTLITGLETKIFGPKNGKKYDLKELLFALGLLREIKENPAFKEYQLKRIDASSVDSASLVLLPSAPLPVSVESSEESMEIRIGQENYKQKIVLLAGLLSQSKNDIANIKYIDLRFKDPVLKFKAIEKNAR